MKRKQNNSNQGANRDCERSSIPLNFFSSIVEEPKERQQQQKNNNNNNIIIILMERAYRVREEGLEGGARAANSVHELNPLSRSRRRRAKKSRFDDREELLRRHHCNAIQVQQPLQFANGEIEKRLGC